MIFSGEALPDANTLQWAISSAINNDHFNLLRSTDGLTFTTVTRIDGLGSSTDPQDYEFLDKEAPVGRVYYRLEQVGVDGQTITSKMITLDRLAIFNANDFKMQAYPNPADNDITVNFDSELKEDLQLQVFDCWGGLLQTHFVPEGQADLALSLAELPSGIYFLSLRRASSHQIISTSRIIKSGL